MDATICSTCGACDATMKPKDGISRMTTLRAFFRVGACSQTLMRALDRGFNHPMELEERASDPLAGGIVQHGYQCGMLWGSALAAGAEAHRRFGAGPKAEAAAVHATKKAVEAFRRLNREINCLELTETNMENNWGIFKYFVKGGPLLCMSRIMKFGPAAFRAIDEALSEGDFETPAGPASCASALARKMGASEKHAVMAAGLAGGLGLSGGGCGALGAAIWVLGIQGRQEGLNTKDIDAKIRDRIDRFLKASGHEFECAEIVGGTFESAADHAEHVRCGGCAGILETLASEEDVPAAAPARKDAPAAVVVSA